MTTTWNFNYKKENICALSKKTLKNELEMYANNFLDEYDGKRKFIIIYFLITNIIYLAFLFIYFIMFFVIFIIRDLLRNNKKILTGMKPMDIIADIVSYFLLALILHLFDFLTGIFPKFEGWHHDAYKKIFYDEFSA